MDNEKLIRKFDKQANLYEIRRKKQTEREWREKLIGSAGGDVLEVAVGTGANFPYYPKGIKLTAADFSPGMLAKAAVASAEYGIRASLIQSDVASLDFPEHYFDTIVSTLSFCGYDDPLAVLDQFNRWCKPGGQILLMEHGISSNRLVGGMQTLLNPMLRRIVGCNFNRDIAGMLRSKLHIDTMESYMLGTVHLVWAKPLKFDKNRPSPIQE